MQYENSGAFFQIGEIGQAAPVADGLADYLLGGQG